MVRAAVKGAQGGAAGSESQNAEGAPNSDPGKEAPAVGVSDPSKAPTLGPPPSSKPKGPGAGLGSLIQMFSGGAKGGRGAPLGDAGGSEEAAKALPRSNSGDSGVMRGQWRARVNVEKFLVVRREGRKGRGHQEEYIFHVRCFFLQWLRI